MEEAEATGVMGLVLTADQAVVALQIKLQQLPDYNQAVPAAATAIMLELQEIILITEIIIWVRPVVVEPAAKVATVIKIQ